MARPLAVLIIEDNKNDAQLLVRMLTKAGYILTFEQVETAEQMRRAMEKQAWEIVISDFSMPELDGFEALKVLQETGLDIPFIAVSGAMGEETAVAMMKAGAHDYVMKGNLARLAPAVERELEQTEARREARRVEHQKQERAKELRTLFGMSRIIDREGITPGEIYQGVANILPAGWQYPEIAYARIVVRGSEFCTKNFKESAWIQSTPIKVDGMDIGQIEVGYLEKRLDEVEGPFLQEERELIDAVAERIGRLVEMKQAEEVLRVWEWAIESTLNAVAISDLAGNLSYVNPAFLKLWGYGSPAQIVGKSVTDFWQMGEMTAEVMEALRVRGGWVGELMAQGKDGSCFEVEVAASMVKGVTGQPVCMMASFSDITERKRGEKIVLESEARYRALFEGTADAILIADLESRMFRYANPAACRLLGYSEAELQTMGVADIHPKADLPAVVAEFEAQARGDKSLATGLPCLRKDGTVVYADVSAVAMSVDGTPCNVGFFRDITERKRAEEERQQMQAQLLQAQKLESIGTLAGGVAHEINNPIMGIMNYAQLILDKLGPDSPVSGFATEIGKETERVATIVKNLLAFARPEKQHHSPARMSDIVEATLSLISAVMRHDQVALEVDVPADLPQIKCRTQQIEQVIMNLLTNARDALNERYPGYDANKKVAITARLIKKDDRQWIRTTVEDHGPGVPEALRERIFEPFFTTKPRDKGTGLGLSISRGIVTEHGGELSVESAVGEFTRLHLDLPVDNGWELGNGEGGTRNAESGIKQDERGATS